MYTIPFNTAKKIIYSIDYLVNNNDEEAINDIQDIVGEIDSYESLTPGIWMKLGNYLAEKDKLKELVL